MHEFECISWLNRHCPDGGFLQSEMWRAFKNREGFSTEHFEGDGLWGNAIEHTLPFAGKYWYMPRGPVLAVTSSATQSSVWAHILAEAKEHGVAWIRVEPRNDAELAMLREWSREYAVKKAPHDMQPREILAVDISESEEKFFANMKPKTRYNIRLAEKRGVEISSDRNEQVFNEFLRMNRETAVRNHISTHPDRHYQHLLELFPHETLELFTARHDGQTLAAILVAFFGDTATYLHGASSDDDRGLMAPYLLQSHAIETARRRNGVRYDFGGIDTTGAVPSFSGITRFKQGFAKNVNAIQYPGSYDIVLIPSRYVLYKSISMSKAAVIKAKRHLTK